MWHATLEQGQFEPPKEFKGLEWLISKFRDKTEHPTKLEG
jgi:hypothetical protein